MDTFCLKHFSSGFTSLPFSVSRTRNYSQNIGLPIAYHVSSPACHLEPLPFSARGFMSDDRCSLGAPSPEGQDGHPTYSHQCPPSCTDVGLLQSEEPKQSSPLSLIGPTSTQNGYWTRVDRPRNMALKEPRGSEGVKYY